MISMTLKSSSVCEFMDAKGFQPHVKQETTDKGTLTTFVFKQHSMKVIPSYLSNHEGNPVWVKILTIIGKGDTRRIDATTHADH